MKTISVRELRITIPRLTETLAEEEELILVSHGEPVARILPITDTAPRLEPLDWLRAKGPKRRTGSEHAIRSERDRRGT